LQKRGPDTAAPSLPVHRQLDPFVPLDDDNTQDRVGSVDCKGCRGRQSGRLLPEIAVVTV
jgi:hypothetical protein